MAWVAFSVDKKGADRMDDELTHLVEHTRPKQLTLAVNDVTYLVAHKLRYVLFLVVLAVSASVIPSPSTQFVKLSFFATKYGGGDCQRTPSSDACRRASSDAAVYHGIAGAISHSVAWLFALMLGSFSDGHGRRPILCAAGCLSLLSRISLAMHLLGSTTLWLFLIVEPILTIFDVHGIFLAVMNDVVKDRKERIVANSVTMGVMLGTAGLAGLIGGALPAKVAVSISIMLGVGQLVFLFSRFPETVPVQLRGGIENISNSDFNPWELVHDSAQIVLKSPFIYRMTLVLIFSGLSATGFHNTFVPYLAAYLGFNQHTNGLLLLAGGISIVVSFTFAMRPLIAAYGEIGTTRLLLALKVVFYVLCTASWTATQVFLVHIFLLGPVVLLIPIMATIQSNLVDDEEQGRMQGILTAVKVLATAVGEIFFTWFYKSKLCGPRPHRILHRPMEA
jgi:MFS family permease